MRMRKNMVSEITHLEVLVALGVFDFEKQAKQRVLVSVKMFGDFPDGYRWKKLDDCIDYYRVAAHVLEEWPAREHTETAEELANDLATFIFFDEKIISAEIRIEKPDVIQSARSVGVHLFVERAY